MDTPLLPPLLPLPPPWSSASPASPGSALARPARRRGLARSSACRAAPRATSAGVVPVAGRPDRRRPACGTPSPGTAPTHVFVTAWARQETEAENIRVNGAMVRDVLEAVRPAGVGAPRRAADRAQALPRPVRGLRPGRRAGHAVPRGRGPAATTRTSTTRRRTSSSRPPTRDGFTWSVHRAAHDHRLRPRQRDEHGPDARRAGRDLPRAGTARSSSRGPRPSGTA